MIKLMFESREIMFQCKSNEYMKDIFKRFAIKCKKIFLKYIFYMEEM